MSEFFEYIVWLAGMLVDIYGALPFMPGFHLGALVVAVFIFSVLIGALVSQLRGFSLSSEAHLANRHSTHAGRLDRHGGS